jgi:hypothetical protein
MNATEKRHWLVRVLLFSIVYTVVGITFSALASFDTQIMWRWAAWSFSAVAYALHIWYEHFRESYSPRSTALHTSSAAALGAFGLAVAANVHALRTDSGNQVLLALALVLWPILTAVPAFLVALAVATVLVRMRPRIEPRSK